MSKTDLRGDERESFGRWLLALIAALMLTSTLLVEWMRIRGR